MEGLEARMGNGEVSNAGVEQVWWAPASALTRARSAVRPWELWLRRYESDVGNGSIYFYHGTKSRTGSDEAGIVGSLFIYDNRPLRG